MDAGRQFQPFEHATVVRVDAAQIAVVAFPRAMPQLTVDPADAGDETVGFERAQHRAGGRVDLHDAAFAVLAYPQAAIGPGHARVATFAGGGNRGQHGAGGGIDLVDARFGQLVQVGAVESGAGVGRTRQAACDLSAVRIDGDQALTGGGPDVAAVVGDAGHAFAGVEGAVFAGDFNRADVDCVARCVVHGGLLDGRRGQSTQTTARRGVTRSS